MTIFHESEQIDFTFANGWRFVWPSLTPVTHICKEGATPERAQSVIQDADYGLLYWECPSCGATIPEVVLYAQIGRALPPVGLVAY